MYKLMFAFTALVLTAGVASARAGGGGHMNIAGWAAELPAPNDSMAPLWNRLTTPILASGNYGPALFAHVPEGRAADPVSNGSDCQGRLAYLWSAARSCF